ncbi:MAG: tRNA lysidine(34) synthetase TilS [bacterium]|nr:tRNA lysidine(34) synthetase TilS [bacterium]
MNKVFEFLDSYINDGDTVVLGCSGGPDSMALMDILISYRESKNISIVCAHVNHKLRRESDDEMKWLESFCTKRGICFEKMIIENYGDDNFHNEARNIRYEFFESLVEKYNASYLMTAHHGDDLVETILMRIVRGSTLRGYAGFSSCVKKDSYSILRPLIFVTKEDILSYDKKRKIDYVIDNSNFSSKYTRNRYRKMVLPFLKTEDKNVHLKFLKYSNELFISDEFLSVETSKLFDELVTNGQTSISKFKKVHPFLQDRFINMLFEKFYQDDLILISNVHTDLIKGLIYSNKANSFVYLPNNVKVVKCYDNLSFVKETEQVDRYEIELSDYVNLPNGKNIKFLNKSDVNDNNFCRLNSEDICLPLQVRTRKSGDRIKVKGLNGTKKVKDIFIDLKIPVKQRDLWPVVVDSKDVVVWLPGLKKSKFDVPKSKSCDIILKYY